MTTPHEVVTAAALPRPIGYAHAVVAAAGRSVHLGGQTAQGHDGGIRGASLIEQFEIAADNVVSVLSAAGGTPEQLVSMVVYVTDMAEYRASLRELGDVWRAHFGHHYPALAVIGVHELFDPAARVELMGVAVIP